LEKLGKEFEGLCDMIRGILKNKILIKIKRNALVKKNGVSSI